MAINETLGVTAKFTTAKGTVLTKSSSPVLTINDTSNYNVVINITKDWKTTAASSKYGNLHIKPTINVADEIISRIGPISSSLRYLIVIAADVAVIGDNENVGALHVDARVPAGAIIDCDCYGLLMGRGGRGSSHGAAGHKVLDGGGDGGPAITNVSANVRVTVYGGMTGGGGGGGGRGAHWYIGYYNTAINEWWNCDMNQPTSGAGAPFGLRMGTYFTGGNPGAEEFFYKNAALGIGLDVAPAAVIQLTPAGKYNLEPSQTIQVSLNPQNDMVTAYTRGSTVIAPINKPIIHQSKWWRLIKEKTPYLTSVIWPYTIYNNDHLIKDDHAYLMELNKNARNTGAIVENTGAAGLFRGAKGAVGGRVNSPGITRYLCCSPQSVVDRIAPRLRGDVGGDVGAARGVPTPLQPVTTHVGYFGRKYQFELLEGFVGTDHHSGKPNSEAMTVLPPSTGGKAGANSKNLNNGTVSIVRGSGGAIGGPEVLTKYDPNGTFDTNARGTNVLKTFPPRWYEV